MFNPSTQLLVYLLFSFQILYSQPVKDHFILEGKITGLDNGVIYLGYYDESQQAGKTDSSYIRNGLFSFSGKLKNQTVAFIKLNKKEAFGLNATDIFLEPTIMKIELQLNNFHKVHLTGSGIQSEHDELTSKWNNVKINHPALFDSNGFVHNDLNSSLSEKLAIVFDTLNKIDYDYFSQHPDSYLTAYLLQYQARNLSSDSLSLFYNRLSNYLKTHVVTQNIRSRIKNLHVGSIGTMGAKFIGKDINGNDFYSGLLKDKFILLDFWASWCVPCRKNSKHIMGLFEKYNKKGLKIIGIADDRDTSKWKAAIKNDGISLWTQVLRGANPELKEKGLKDDGDINDKFGVHILPTYILIDSHGVIIGRFEDDIHELDKLLSTIFK